MTDLTDSFVTALAFATERHGEQRRKGTDVPYVSHLLGTCALVLEDGGDEEEAIAGLLHNTLEDQVATFDEIAEEFGETVAGIVRECSDTALRNRNCESRKLRRWPRSTVLSNLDWS